MSIGHLARTPLTVYRPNETGDGMGGQAAASAVAGTIRGQVKQPTDEDRLVAGQFGARLDHVVHTVYSADVRRGDELDGPLPSSVAPGRRLHVLAVVSNSRKTYRRVLCEVTQSQGA